LRKESTEGTEKNEERDEEKKEVQVKRIGNNKKEKIKNSSVKEIES